MITESDIMIRYGRLSSPILTSIRSLKHDQLVSFHKSLILSSQQCNSIRIHKITGKNHP